MTRTFLQSVQDVADDLGLRKSGIVTGGAADTVTAANYPFRSSRTNASTRQYEGSEIYITTGNWTGTPNPNQVAAYSPTTGAFTVGNSYASDTPAALDTFDLYLRGVSIIEIRQAVNQALRNLRYETWVPLTIIDDGDMETTGTAEWLGTNSTLAKVGTQNNLLRGSQALSVTATSTPGYAINTPWYGDPTYSREWYVQALVRAHTGTARLIIYDLTNSAEIKTASWTMQGWGTIGFQFTLPATCESFQVRLESSTSGNLTYWDDVIVYPLGAFELALPSWITQRAQLLGVFMGTPGANLAGRADDKLYHPVRHLIHEDFTNPLSQFRVELADPTTTQPLYLQVKRPYSELSVDTDTTYCDRDLLTYYGSLELLKRLQNRPQTEDVAAWHAEYMSRKQKRPRSRNIPLTLNYSGSY